MSEGKRPGGLTVLAVLNFVFGGLGILGLLASVALFAFIGKAAASNSEGSEEARKVVQAWEAIGTGLFYGMMAVGTVATILMIASGVGYLQQKKFLGRGLGNAYAVLSIAQSLIMALVVKNPEVGGGFGTMTMIGLVYPVLTLVLLNTTFKEDFVR